MHASVLKQKSQDLILCQMPFFWPKIGKHHTQSINWQNKEFHAQFLLHKNEQRKGKIAGKAKLGKLKLLFFETAKNVRTAPPKITMHQAMELLSFFFQQLHKFFSVHLWPCRGLIETKGSFTILERNPERQHDSNSQMLNSSAIFLVHLKR